MGLPLRLWRQLSRGPSGPAVMPPSTRVGLALARQGQRFSVVRRNAVGWQVGSSRARRCAGCRRSRDTSRETVESRECELQQTTDRSAIRQLVARSSNADRLPCVRSSSGRVNTETSAGPPPGAESVARLPDPARPALPGPLREVRTVSVSYIYRLCVSKFRIHIGKGCRAAQRFLFCDTDCARHCDTVSHCCPL